MCFHVVFTALIHSTFLPPPFPAECSGPGTETNIAETSNAALTTASGRIPDTFSGRLGSRIGHEYLPEKASFCEQCASCKPQVEQGGTVPGADACRKSCRRCPYEVLIGAERAITIEVGGITATAYVSDDPVGGQSNGVIITQYATTIFEGQWRSGNVGSTARDDALCLQNEHMPHIYRTGLIQGGIAIFHKPQHIC